MVNPVLYYGIDFIHNNFTSGTCILFEWTASAGFLVVNSKTNTFRRFLNRFQDVVCCFCFRLTIGARKAPVFIASIYYLYGLS